MPLDDETRKALEDIVSNAIAGLTDKDSPIMRAVHTANSGAVRAMEGTLDERLASIPKPDAPNDLELKALSTKVETQNGTISALESKIKDYQVRTEILGDKALIGLNEPKEFVNLFIERTGKSNFTVSDGTVYVTKGDTVTSVSDAIATFKQTNLGKLFVPPTATPNGSDSKQPGDTKQPNGHKRTEADLTLDLKNAFAVG